MNVGRNDFGEPAQGAPKNVEKFRVENNGNVVSRRITGI